MGISKVPSQPSLLQAEQAQLPQPLLVGEMFQSPHHPFPGKDALASQTDDDLQSISVESVVWGPAVPGCRGGLHVPCWLPGLCGGTPAAPKPINPLLACSHQTCPSQPHQPGASRSRCPLPALKIPLEPAQRGREAVASSRCRRAQLCHPRTGQRGARAGNTATDSDNHAASEGFQQDLQLLIHLWGAWALIFVVVY